MDGPGTTEPLPPAVAQDDTKKERKRLQNRRNQQARRDRLRQSKEDEDPKSSFSVRRWRLKQDEETSKTSHQKGSSQSGKELIPKSTAPSAAKPTRLDPQADMLLHLITQNVTRGFLSNKIVLRTLVQEFYRDFPSTEQHMADPQPCEGLIVSIPLSDGIPSSLLPTQMQMDVPHSAWINVMPFARMRDNLIRWHEHFSHWEFLVDMGGYLVDKSLFMRPHTAGPPPSGSTASKYKVDGAEDVDDPLSEWNGAIVWGEPYRKENWEFTIHFLVKWAWVFEGCEEMITVTNTWRQGRGAPLLRSAGHAVGNLETFPRVVEETGA